MSRLITILIACLFISACADYKIKTSQDPQADFSTYSSWCWLNNCSPTFEGPSYIYEKKLMVNMVDAIAQEMYKKGYEQLDESDADLLVDFRLVLKEDSTLNSIIHEDALPLWENYREGDPYYHFLKGSLIIDIADRKKGKVVWRSVTERYMPEYPNMSFEEVHKGIKKALKAFPKAK